MKRRVLLSITLFLLVISVSAIGGKQLIFASTLIRHGDRTPTHFLKSDPYDWKGGIGELTPHGMRQEFDLGSKMRKRYVDELKLLSADYVNNSVYVRCTDFNRTIMSAESFLYGLYPLGSGPLMNSSDEPALPKKFQPIPVRTLPKDQDYLLLAKDNYEKEFEKRALEYLNNDKEWNDKNRELQDKFKIWGEKFDVQVHNLTDMISIGDNLNVRLKNNISLPKGVTKDEAEEIIHLSQWAQAQRYKSINISGVLAKVLLKQIAENMKLAIENKNINNYVLYSAHDSTVMPVMSAMGAALDFCPPYASHIDFELYKNDDKYFVSVRYNDKTLYLKKDMESIPFDEFNVLVNKIQQYNF